ncbi:MAG: molybdopterin biosynthesis protein, partial [Oscillospiraceae bacterium]|nr:molybdopterin biosynthesis protein [Oscillospiraceae bacterium]
MAISRLEGRPLEEVKTEYTELLRKNGMRPLPEEIDVCDSCGRVTFDAVYAALNAPRWHSCAMDGAALFSGDTVGASEAVPVFITGDRCFRVSSGDPLPEGCDCVVREEDVIEAPDGIELCREAVPWQHVRQIGEDMCEGEMLLPSLTYIRPAAVGAMLASGVGRIRVCRRPAVGVIVPASGGADHNGAENYAILSSMLREWGAVPELITADSSSADALEAALKDALPRCDAVIMCGGSSTDEDAGGAEALSRIGTVFCHGLAIKPGKPALLGYSGAKPIIGIPEYPVSAI